MKFFLGVIAVLLLSFSFSNTVFSNNTESKDMKQSEQNNGLELGMYSKVYWVTVDPEKADETWEHYDSFVAPAVIENEHHADFSHQVIAVEPGKWLLVSNYFNKEAAEASAPLVKELVGPMVKKFGAGLELITEGEMYKLINR